MIAWTLPECCQGKSVGKPFRLLKPDRNSGIIDVDIRMVAARARVLNKPEQESMSHVRRPQVAPGSDEQVNPM